MSVRSKLRVRLDALNECFAYGLGGGKKLGKSRAKKNPFRRLVCMRTISASSVAFSRPHETFLPPSLFYPLRAAPHFHHAGR